MNPETQKTLFLVNPTAGRKKCGERWRPIEGALKKADGFPFEVHYTSRPLEGMEVASEAITADFQRIIVVGGDGTLHEVVNGIAGNPIPVGIFPFGTGNDVARSLGLLKTGNSMLNILNSVRTVSMNVARVNDEYFIMAAGVGFDASVAAYLNRQKAIKTLGAFGYLAGVLRTLTSFRPSNIRLSIDGTSREIEQAWMVGIGNCAFYGGGMKLFPSALVDDDLLDICVIANLHKVDVFKVLPRVYSGKHVQKNTYVSMFTGTDITVEFPENMLAHADGEFIAHKRLAIGLSPHPVNILTF